MNCLHEMKPQILHLDLKTSNLLVIIIYKYIEYFVKVDENMVVKIADFGLSQLKKKKNKEKVGYIFFLIKKNFLVHQFIWLLKFYVVKHIILKQVY